MDRSKSLERRRQRHSHPKMRSTTQRRDMTTNPLVSLGFPMTSTVIRAIRFLERACQLVAAAGAVGKHDAHRVLTGLHIGAGRGDIDRNVTGILVHDDAASDFTLEDMRHAACNAHHRRELQTLVDIGKEDGTRSMHRLFRTRPQGRAYRTRDRPGRARVPGRSHRQSP